MLSLRPALRPIGRAILASSLLAPTILGGAGILAPGLLTGTAQAQGRGRAAAPANAGATLPLPLPPPNAPELQPAQAQAPAVPAGTAAVTAPSAPPPVATAPFAPAPVAPAPVAAADPASVAPVTVSVVPAPPDAASGPALQRRIDLGELGLPAGLAFGAEGRDLVFPLPRGLPDLSSRLSLAFDLAAPFGGRQAVEVMVNGRVLASRAFGAAGDRLSFDLPIPAEDLARMDGVVLLHLRLVGDAASATATLRPASYLALLLPAAPELSVAALFRLLPQQTQVLLRPGTISPREAATALGIGLALSGTGRQVQIASAPPGQPPRGSDGSRLWETGAVLVGQGSDAAAVRMVDGLPVLVLGGEAPERAAQLLDGRWRSLATGPALQLDAPDAASETPVLAAVETALPFAALRGSTAPQDGARPEWNLDFSTRDLPAGTRPQAIELDLRAAPVPGSARTVATVLMNRVILGSARFSPEGSARLVLPIPDTLLDLDNHIAITMDRAGGTGPAQVLPSSRIRLGPAPAPRAFLDLPPLLAEGLEVIADAPDGALVAEQLNPLLWVLRALVPSGSPIRVTLSEPGVQPAPSGPFLAATLDPPAGSTPPLRFDEGRVVVLDRAGQPVLNLAGTQRAMAVQLVRSGGHPGLWLRALGPMPLLPPAPPRLDRGDVALLDGSGVARAWGIAPATATASLAYPDQSQPSLLMALRPWIVGVLWLLGFGLVTYAFIRPRRDQAA